MIWETDCYTPPVLGGAAIFSRSAPVVCLAAQCEIPPLPYRTIPFRDSIAKRGIAPICLVFIGYRASIAEIPLLRGEGYRTSTSHALPRVVF